jgi:hypothetical protein
MLHQYDPKSVWYVERIMSRRYVIHESPMALYFRKRSEVETREGGVVYRRRIFRWFGLRQSCYIVYYFRRVDDIDDDAHNCYWVTGRISAVYLLADGQTVQLTKSVRHVSLPKTFTDMEKIRKALEALQK